MNREELIKQCRYYKGEKQCPFNDNHMEWFWDMERVWVDNNGKFVGEGGYYETIGGKHYPGIPISLLYVMFTSWGKTSFDITKEISSFYDIVEEYLDIPSDVIPKDKIPG